MNISKTNNLSFYNEQGILTLNAKQFDTGRKFVFHIMDSDVPFDLPENCSAYLRIAKADGTQFQGHECCKIDGSKITIDPSVGNGSQIFAAAGTNVCELHLEDADGISLTTWNFNIYVEPRVHDGSHVASIDSYDVIDVAIAMEKERVKNEQIRINNEAKRIEDEKQRILEESKRLENETERQNTFGTVLNKAELYVTTASVCAYNAKKSEINSAKCEENAFNHATEAESYAHGATGVRDGEDTDNAKYYKEQAQKVFENLQRSTVTGVKGDAESEYRIGNVNITPENVGALSLKKGGTVENTFKVNKVSTTNPTGLIELDIHNDGKVAFNTNSSGNSDNSLIHLSGDYISGVTSINGSEISIKTSNIKLNNSNCLIDIIKSLVIHKGSTSNSEVEVNQIVIDSGNEIGFNCLDSLATRTNSLLHLIGNHDNGITTLRGTEFDIYTEKILLIPDNGITRINTKNLYIGHIGSTEQQTENPPKTYIYMEDDKLELGILNDNGDGKCNIRFNKLEFGASNNPLLEMDGSYNENGRMIKMHGGKINAYVRNNGIDLVKVGFDDRYVLDAVYGTLGNEANPWNKLFLKCRKYNEDDGYDYETTIYNNNKYFYIETYNEDSDYDWIDVLRIGNGQIMFGHKDHNSTYNDAYITNNSFITYVSALFSFGTRNANLYIYSNYPSNNNAYIAPNNSGEIKFDLGHSNAKWNNIYAQNGTIQTSDRNAKNTIEELSREQAQKLIYGLKPSTYKMNSGTSDRTHWGMISQDIEELLEQLGWTSLDFAGFIKSPKMHIEEEERDPETGKVMKERMEEIIEGEYDYSLRYDEFIAPMIKVIQSQHEEIQNQNKHIETLEKRLELLEQKLLLE